MEISAAIQIGQVTIEPGDRDGYLWISWSDGEGMEIEEAKLADCLESFYHENF